MPLDFVRPIEYNITIQLVMEYGVNYMEFITAAQAAQKWQISQRRVQILCLEGRIEGVFKLGDAWAIPSDAVKPYDLRIKREEKEIQKK